MKKKKKNRRKKPPVNQNGNMVIDGQQMLMNRAGKESKADPHVHSGTGAHRSKKDYRRNPKHKKPYDY